MRAIVYLIFIGTFFTAGQAINNSPIDGIPYCRVVENGFTTDANQEVFRLSEYLCYPGSVAFAIFYNGKDTGFDLTMLGYISDFWIASAQRYNGTINTSHPKVGILYDIGSDDCRGGIGIVDGTFDAVDGALSITFDGIAYGGGVNTSNLTTTCSPTSTSFTLGPDVLPKGLITRRTFYIPSAASEAWARVVDEVHNPTDIPVFVSIGYYNNVGSDEDTHYYNKSDGYSFSGQIPHVPGAIDNLVSLHWAKSAQYPNGFHTNKRFYNGTKMPLFADGNDDVLPYWNVTIPAGKMMTFMMIMNQGAFDLGKMYDSVMDIEKNPLKLYADMTNDQLSTLKNFNACLATIPQIKDWTPKTYCSESDGKAIYDLSVLLQSAPTDCSVIAHDIEGNVIATNDDTLISLPSGTFTVTLKYGPCDVIITGQITVTCPAPVPSSHSSPATTNAPSFNTPAAPSSSTPSMSVTSGCTDFDFSIYLVVIFIYSLL